MGKPSRRFILMAGAATLAVLLASVLLTAIYRQHDARAMLLPNQVITVFPEPKPLTDFSLADQDNHAFDLTRLRGKWSFLFFGFTHCPDICPTTLALLASVHDKLVTQPGHAEDVQFVFVSVDPIRDSRSNLKQYVRYFDESFVGVTGEERQIANLASQLGAAFQVDRAPGVENYPVYHTTALFLLDPRARLHAVLTPPHDASAISERFKIVREIDASEVP